MDVFALLFRLQGRIGRAQYWLGICVSLALSALGYFINPPFAEFQDLTIALIAFAISLINLWICICIMAKRYHDRGKSAWWILFALIPIIGWIWSFIELGLLRGDEASNDYGADPTHSFNVAGDIETMRQQAGHKPPASAGVATNRAAAAMMRRPRSPYTDGRPVFGKRV
jgi:uncharacterized membrane protein YhaH (DUF805 family)